jgi:fucose permease
VIANRQRPGAEPPHPRHALYRVACAGMFVFGMVLALPGTVLGLPDAAARFDLTLATRGLLISIMFLGLLVGSLASGPLVDGVGHRRALAASALLVALCLPWFAAAQGWTMAAVALAAVGVACAGVNTASNALSSDLFPQERGRRLNGLAIAVGLGGLTLPAATAATVGVVTWRAVVGAGALVALAVAASAVRNPGTTLHATRPRPAGASIALVLRQRGFGWIGLLVLLGAGNEASMAGFTSTYLTTLGLAPGAATLVLSSHWVGLIAGRVLFGSGVDRAKDRAIVLAAAASAAAVLLLVLSERAVLLACLPFVVGLAMGIIVPTALALGGERYPHSAGTVFGLLLTVAQAGAMLLPAAIGAVSQAAGVRWGVGILALTNVAIVFVVMRSRGATSR